MEDEKKSRTISFVTTPSLEKALREAAAQEDRTVSWIIGKSIERYLTDQGVLKKQKSSAR